MEFKPIKYMEWAKLRSKTDVNLSQSGVAGLSFSRAAGSASASRQMFWSGDWRISRTFCWSQTYTFNK